MNKKPNYMKLKVENGSKFKIDETEANPKLQVLKLKRRTT